MSTIACNLPPVDSQLDIVGSPVLSIAGLAAWRAAVTIYLWGLLIYNMAQQKSAGGLFFLFNLLTIHSIILSAVFYSIAAAAPVYYHLYPQNEEERNKLIRILVNLQSLAAPLAITVVVGFWSFIPDVTVLNIHNHGMRLRIRSL